MLRMSLNTPRCMILSMMMLLVNRILTGPSSTYKTAILRPPSKDYAGDGCCEFRYKMVFNVNVEFPDDYTADQNVVGGREEPSGFYEPSKPVGMGIYQSSISSDGSIIPHILSICPKCYGKIGCYKDILAAKYNSNMDHIVLLEYINNQVLKCPKMNSMKNTQDDNSMINLMSNKEKQFLMVEVEEKTGYQDGVLVGLSLIDGSIKAWDEISPIKEIKPIKLAEIDRTKFKNIKEDLIKILESSTPQSQEGVLTKNQFNNASFLAHSRANDYDVRDVVFKEETRPQTSRQQSTFPFTDNLYIVYFSRLINYGCLNLVLKGDGNDTVDIDPMKNCCEFDSISRDLVFVTIDAQFAGKPGIDLKAHVNKLVGNCFVKELDKNTLSLLPKNPMVAICQKCFKNIELIQKILDLRFSHNVDTLVEVPPPTNSVDATKACALFTNYLNSLIMVNDNKGTLSFGWTSTKYVLGIYDNSLRVFDPNTLEMKTFNQIHKGNIMGASVSKYDEIFLENSMSREMFDKYVGYSTVDQFFPTRMNTGCYPFLNIVVPTNSNGSIGNTAKIEIIREPKDRSSDEKKKLSLIKTYNFDKPITPVESSEAKRKSAYDTFQKEKDAILTVPLNKKIEELTKDKDIMTKKISDLEEEIQNLKLEINNAVGSKTQLEKEYKQSFESIDKLKEENEQLKGEIKIIQKEIEEKQSHDPNAKVLIDDLQQKLNVKKAKIAHLESEILEKTSQIEKLSKMLDGLDVDINNRTQLVNQKQRSVNDNKGALSQNEKQITNLTTQLAGVPPSSIYNSNDSKEQKILKLNASLDNYLSDYKEAIQKIRDLGGEVSESNKQELLQFLGKGNNEAALEMPQKALSESAKTKETKWLTSTKILIAVVCVIAVIAMCYMTLVFQKII